MMGRRPKVDYMGDMASFHEKFELGYDGPPRDLDLGLFEFRYSFMKEELQEYYEAWVESNREQMLDALVDLLYVTFGTAYLHGFDIDEAWRRVHAANMKKIKGKTHRVFGKDFDVAKPEGWQPAKLGDLI